MKRKLLLTLILTSMMMTSCGGMIDVEPPKVDEDVQVALDSHDLVMSIGENHTLSAFVEGTETVTWINSDPNVVMMQKNDLTATITAVREGSATITAIAAHASASCKVQVGGGSSIVTSITLSATNKEIDLEETFELIASVVATGKTPEISFASSNEDIAKITNRNASSATIKGIHKGEATITVTSGGKRATCLVTVSEKTATLAVTLNKNTANLNVNDTVQLSATTIPSELTVNWSTSDNSVANVSKSGLVTALKEGSATISATVTDGTNYRSAECVITVSSGEASDYEKSIASWSKAGHLYLHYLRKSDTDYNKWALWVWQNYPNDSEGSLWGANPDYTLAVDAYEYYSMRNSECGKTGDGQYIDEYGIVIDVDLTDQNVVGGKNGVSAPLVLDNQWESAMYSKLKLGFLIVDQTMMTGEDMWTSDGGAETYIRLGKLMPEGRSSYLHVYCVEGAVGDFTTSSGKQEVNNPTLNDDTGKYVSKNDITNLKYDAFPSGVSTSTTFLNDEPGVGYQIFVPSFADSDGDGYGDIQGIISKLDYLDTLGVNVLWLTPIQESNSYHGYDVTDYYKIDERFGTLADYQELLYKAHERGMKVLMDMVINHTSKSNVLFKKSQRAETEIINGKTINYRDMYLWKFEGDDILEWDGVEVPTGTPANFIRKNVEESDDWYRDGTSKYYYYGKFGSGMAELNYSSQATRDYMTDMCKYWLSFGLDGFRLDAIKHIYLVGELDPDAFFNNYLANDYITYDVSYRTYWNEDMQDYVTAQNDYSYDRDLNVMFWKQFAGTIKSAYPNCFLVGENYDGWNTRMAPFYESMDSQFDFSTYYHLNENGFNGMGYDIKTTLETYRSYRGNAINGAFTSNHDTGISRMLNHAAAYLSGSHHAEITTDNKVSANNNARIYAAITLLTPGVSWIFYGDELGMSGNLEDEVPDSTGYIVEDHGNNIDRWNRQPMRWGTTRGQDMVVNYKFSGLEVLWDFYNQNLPTAAEQMSNTYPNSMFKFFQAVCAAKNSEYFPTYGYINNYWDEVSGSMICIQIKDASRTVNCFINYSGTTQTISAMNRGTLISATYGGSETTVGPFGVTVVRK